MMIQTLNFNPIDDPKLRCTCRAVSCDHRMVKQWVLDNLQLMRNDIKRSMIVTSGGRCSSHPNEINKDLPGDHQLCDRRPAGLGGRSFCRRHTEGYRLPNRRRIPDDPRPLQCQLNQRASMEGGAGIDE